MQQNKENQNWENSTGRGEKKTEKDINYIVQTILELH
jgi:hypothetical protein